MTDPERPTTEQVEDIVDLDVTFPFANGVWDFDVFDALLYAMLTDPVYMPEILWKNPNNRQYGGCYRVRDYQYKLNRCRRSGSNKKATYMIAACARSVGKTESEKVHAEIHLIEAQGEDMGITAPELIHLLPVTQAIEDHIRDVRLLRDCLDTRNGQTGFTHRPFGVKMLDGTKLDGRIPKQTGTGVKGLHVRKLIVEEGQDYPERGWKEVNETVNYDSVDRDGEPDFSYWIFGVHSGDTSSTFDEKARSDVYQKIQVTALRRPDWGKERKDNAIASYGGTSSPDYRRNIYGEPGSGASRYFVRARLMACVDQRVPMDDRPGSDYNERVYVKQLFRAEELDGLGMSIADLLDLPEVKGPVWMGADIGLTTSPTEVLLFDEATVEREQRLRLLRRFTLERFRPQQIRQVFYAVAWHFGHSLAGFGVDSTGLGLPIWQDMEDDEVAPPHLLDVSAGYFFNSKLPVKVEKKDVTEANGIYRDQYGTMVKREVNELTGEETFIAMMPFIQSSTRFIAKDVDSKYLLLPFDKEIVTDMLGETKQRVERMGQRAQAGQVKKGDQFHILDAMRACFQRKYGDEAILALADAPRVPVLDYAG